MVNIALIGVGRWGINILRTLPRIAGCRVAAICNTDTTDASALLTSPAAIITRDYHELLGRPDIDGVIIATPATTHTTIALPFIKRGTPTFIEKPLATDEVSAVALQEAARLKNTLVMVGHIHLYNPAYLTLKSLVTKIGKIRLVLFEGMNNGPYRSDTSALWDWAPHDVALALDLLRSEPDHIQAWGINVLRPTTNLYDVAALKMSFPNNVQVLSLVSWLSPEKRKKLTVIGENSTVVFDDTAAKKVIFYENMGPQVQAENVTRQEPTISYPHYSSESPLQRELQAFIQSISTHQVPPTSLEQGVTTVRIIAAAEKSIAAHSSA
ncbi:MAG: Gfo/Idh/MocA family oxidoreductase [Candidatus Andersenbacteria bacterium]